MLLGIKELEERTGLTRQTINSYIDYGLIPSELIIQNNSKNHRKFKEEAIGYFLVAGSLLQDIPFSRSEVKNILMEIKVSPKILAKKINTLPYPKFIKFLIEQKANIKETPYLDKLLSMVNTSAYATEEKDESPILLRESSEDFVIGVQGVKLPLSIEN